MNCRIDGNFSKEEGNGTTHEPLTVRLLREAMPGPN